MFQDNVCHLVRYKVMPGADEVFLPLITKLSMLSLVWKDDNFHTVILVEIKKLVNQQN